MSKIQNLRKWLNRKDTCYKVQHVFRNRSRLEWGCIKLFLLSFFGGMIPLVVLIALFPSSRVELSQYSLVPHPVVGGFAWIWLVVSFGSLIIPLLLTNKTHYSSTIDPPSVENISLEELQVYLDGKIYDQKLKALLETYILENPTKVTNLLLLDS